MALPHLARRLAVSLPILLGVLSALFFAVTFVANRMLSLGGGNWMWTASLRYLLMLPVLLFIATCRRKLKQLLTVMGTCPWDWMLWGTVGFGLFYAPLCYSAVFGPAWLIAGAWQITIVAGILLTPLTHSGEGRPSSIPVRELGVSLFILLGVGLLALNQASRVSVRVLLSSFIPVAIAAFAYPLGNRRVMLLCSGKLETCERLLGMTIGSLPFWIGLSGVAALQSGPPQSRQVVGALVVAMLSGVVATTLFFMATDMASHSSKQLAAVEATQAAEVVFTLLGEFVLVPGTHVSRTALVGIGIITLGLVIHSVLVQQGSAWQQYHL